MSKQGTGVYASRRVVQTDIGYVLTGSATPTLLSTLLDTAASGVTIPALTRAVLIVNMNTTDDGYWALKGSAPANTAVMAPFAAKQAIRLPYAKDQLASLYLAGGASHKFYVVFEG